MMIHTKFYYLTKEPFFSIFFIRNSLVYEVTEDKGTLCGIMVDSEIIL